MFRKVIKTKKQETRAQNQSSLKRPSDFFRHYFGTAQEYFCFCSFSASPRAGLAEILEKYKAHGFLNKPLSFLSIMGKVKKQRRTHLNFIPGIKTLQKFLEILRNAIVSWFPLTFSHVMTLDSMRFYKFETTIHSITRLKLRGTPLNFLRIVKKLQRNPHKSYP